MLLLLLTVAWSYAFLAGTLQFRYISAVDRVLVFAGLPFVVGAWVAARTRYGLWLLLGGPGSLILAAALNNGVSQSDAWIYLSVSAGHLTFVFIVLANRWIGAASIVAGGGLLAAIWAHHPTNVSAGPLAVGHGWIAVAALMANGIGVWVAWHKLLNDSVAADRSYSRLEERTASELGIQERSRAWRAAAVAVHERLLSTIRYVLQSDQLDRASLKQFNSTLPESTFAVADLGRSLAAATAARLAANIVRLEPSAVLLPIAPEALTAVRAAIVECALNAVQHGAATEVVVTGAVRRDRVLVHITDNGNGLPPDAVAGIGWTTVLEEGLAEFGGGWSVHRETEHTIVTMSLPIAASTGVRSPESGRAFDQGRLLMSSPLIGFAAVGVAYYWIIGINTGSLLLISESMAATAAALWLVVTVRRTSLLRAGATVLALAIIPWLIWAASPEKSQVFAVGAAINACGYGIIAVAVWSRWHMWLLGLGVWMSGALITAEAFHGVSVFPVFAALMNTAVTLPITAGVASVSTKRFARAQAALDLERETIRRETLRSSAAVVINQHLASCVNEAEQVVTALADGAELTPAVRHNLSCLDGLIRATIQVDPTQAGTFARLASQLVAFAFSRAVPANVGTIIASRDMRPIDPVFQSKLNELVSEAETISVRAFKSGDRDYLALELRPVGAGFGSTLTHLAALQPASLTVEVDSQDAGEVLVVISREVHSVA